MNKSERFWDRTSKYHDNIAKDKAFNRTLEITKKYLKQSDIILDYACATGLYSTELTKNVKEIHGIDISSKMIEVANEKAAPNTIFTKASIFEKYEKETFDVILAFNVLHFLEEEQKVMKRINELLKPEGIFISVTPCLGEKNSFLGVLAILLTKIGILPYIKRFKISELEKLININFNVIKTIELTPKQNLIVAKCIT